MLKLFIKYDDNDQNHDNQMRIIIIIWLFISLQWWFYALMNI
jgi:hypothetical protein